MPPIFFLDQPQSQKKHPGKPITPPPSKKMQRMALLSVKEEGEGTSHPGGSAMTLEDGEDACPTLPFLTSLTEALSLGPPCHGSISHQGYQLWLMLPSIS